VAAVAAVTAKVHRPVILMGKEHPVEAAAAEGEATEPPHPQTEPMARMVAEVAAVVVLAAAAISFTSKNPLEMGGEADTDM
jgi:hypothetical protein